MKALERGDRVVLPDGRTGTLVIAQGDEAIVYCLENAQGVGMPPGDRYAVVALAALVRG